MKKSVMKKWVKALRSGEYQQGHGRLTLHGAYCCLGVLCKISKLDFPKREMLLPLHIMIWAGMSSTDGAVVFKRSPLSLTQLNDMRMRSFKRIAAFIERNWEKL